MDKSNSMTASDSPDDCILTVLFKDYEPAPCRLVDCKTYYEYIRQLVKKLNKIAGGIGNDSQ